MKITLWITMNAGNGLDARMLSMSRSTVSYNHECRDKKGKEGKKQMAAYFVVDVKEISDPQAYEEYRKGVNATLARYGGKFLVRGGTYETIEGDWQPHRFVIVEFDDEEHFKRWYNSPEYREIREIRFKASTARAIVVRGVEG